MANGTGEHAVVMGAGMAGLLVARVLSEFYRTVTVVERDALPDTPVARKGVPQGRHVHSCLSRGSQVMGELFPGLLDELAAAGAVVIDDGDLSRIYARVGRYELNRSGTLRRSRRARCFTSRAGRSWSFTSAGESSSSTTWYSWTTRT